MDKLTVIPFSHPLYGTANLLITEPSAPQDRITENGLYLPATVEPGHETGKVIAMCDGSEFAIGDIITYNTINRDNPEHMDTIPVNGKDCDIISEHGVWSRNGNPHNRIYVEPDTELQMTKSGLVISDKALGVVQKGKIVAAPEKSHFKAGDSITYRKNEGGIFKTVEYGDKTVEVLFDKDIYTLNGKVSPFKIIVKIDMAAQALKRATTLSGIALSPLFQFMLRNLQYGTVTEIGEEAKDIYPMLMVGDTAILHHTIEHDDFRLVRQEYGTHALAYEYRIINCLNPQDPEIFGKIKEVKIAGNSVDTKIIPFHGRLFLDFNFGLWDKGDNKSDLLGVDFTLGFIQDIDVLKNHISSMREKAVLTRTLKHNGYRADLSRLNPEDKNDSYKADEIKAKATQLDREYQEKTQFIEKDHLLLCKVKFPRRVNSEVITAYKALYPINILGKKYLIAHPYYLIANYNSMTEKFEALFDRVLLEPIAEETASTVEIPDSARQKPQRGKIVSVGPTVADKRLQEGRTVLYVRTKGMDIEQNGVKLLMLFGSDCVAIISPDDISYPLLP